MSENEHVAAIKRETYWIRSRYSGHQTLAFRANRVDEHTDALAAQLDQANENREYLLGQLADAMESLNDAEARAGRYRTELVAVMPNLPTYIQAAQMAEAEVRAGRWKRKSLAQDAYEDALLYGADGDEQERVREELRAAHDALKAHGDLPDTDKEVTDATKASPDTEQ
jgi:hypothetical protein